MRTNLFAIFAILASAFALCGIMGFAQQKPPVKIIFDTDMLTDPEDVNALCLLHAFADDGEAEILATVCNGYEHNRSHGAVVDIVNTFYGRPDIPIGTYKGGFTNKRSHYAFIVKDKYPHDAPDDNRLPSALDIYRQTLAAQPDHSVTIVSVGFLLNIHDLLASPKDKYSELTGKELVRRKVKEIVIMGGKYPAGREYNFYYGGVAPSAKYVCDNCPDEVPLIFSGYEIGERIISGKNYRTQLPDCPLRTALENAYGNANVLNSGRHSWDETAVIYAVRGGTEYWKLQTQGSVDINCCDGSCRWVATPDKNQAYMIESCLPDTLATLMENLILKSINNAIRRQMLQAADKLQIDSLSLAFANPPQQETGLRCYWWWLNGLVTEASITHDLEQMKDKGYGGALIFDAGTPPGRRKVPQGAVFLGPEWLKLYQHAVREADRLGMELSINIQSGWNPGSPAVTPELAQKKLVFADTVITGGGRVRTELPMPASRITYRDVMLQAVPASSSKDAAIKNLSVKTLTTALGWQGVYPLNKLREEYADEEPFPIKPDDIIDLTAFFDGKTLEWDAPTGNWQIIRYGWTCTGARTERNQDGWSGLSLDHLNPDAFRLHSATVIEPLIVAAQSVGKSLRYLHSDSWEMGTVNWTNRFPDEFRRLRGYDIAPFMPVLAGRTIISRAVSDRFLFDFRQTTGDCIAENHYQLLSETAHKYGLGIHPEAGGPHAAPIDGLRLLGMNDIPQGEFWARANTHRTTEAARLCVKQCASAGHTNGKRIIAAEGPTSIGPAWERAPRELKPVLDRVFCAGINRIVWQIFTASPEEYGSPGLTYFNGTHLNPKETWWEVADDFVKYLNRNCFLLQQGHFVADVLYYYGDDVPNYVFLKEEFPELPFGYDWDKCSKEVIINRLTVCDGRLYLPDGMSYSLLYLPPEKAINLEVLKKIELLVMQGATVVGQRPETATGLHPKGNSRTSSALLAVSTVEAADAADAEVRAIASRLWGDIDGAKVTVNRYGKGRVVWGQALGNVLSGMSAEPDFVFGSKDPQTKLDYIHRKAANADIYLVVNRFARKGINDTEYRYLTDLPDRYESVECSFRVPAGSKPSLWNPVTGEISAVSNYKEENGRTIVALELIPEGSVFVVFSKTYPSIAAQKPVSPLILSSSKPLSPKWTLRFTPQMGTPEAIETEELKSLTDFSEENIRYYSGKVTYSATFTLTGKERSSRNIVLDLGNLHEMATVRLNGKQVNGLLWQPPYILNITDAIRKGANSLEIDVYNLWPNRLIGDGKLPPDKRFTRTNIEKFDASGADTLLRISGLLGPVNLKFYEK